MSATRDAELAVLDAAASADPTTPELDELLVKFGMQPEHREPFLAVLRAGYWRKAKSPFNFVKSNVFTEDVRDCQDALGDPDLHDGMMEHGRSLFGSSRVGISPELISEDCAVRRYAEDDLIHEVFDSQAQRRGIERVHKSLLDLVPVDPTGEWALDHELRVNWTRVGERMGLDPEEISVLGYMMGQRISLRAAARLSCNQGRQRELRAAWARVERLKDSGKLQSFLENPKISTGQGVITCPARRH